MRMTAGVASDTGESEEYEEKAFPPIPPPPAAAPPLAATLAEIEERVRAAGPNTYLRIGASTRRGADGRHLYTVAIMQSNPGAKSPWRILGEGCASTIHEAFEAAMKRTTPRGPQRPKV